MPFENDTPKVLTSFLTYLNAVRSLSPATIHEYYLDLRTFFRFLKIKRGTADSNASLRTLGSLTLILRLLGLSRFQISMIS